MAELKSIAEGRILLYAEYTDVHKCNQKKMFYSRMTTWLIDMFTRTTLGVRMTDSKNPSNEFAAAFRKFMGEETTFDWIYSLSCNTMWARNNRLPF